MKYKKGLIFICLLICLFNIASVAASDVNETVMANEDQMFNDDMLAVDEQDVDEFGVTEEDELSVSTGSFEQLAKEINNTKYKLNLVRDYTCSQLDANSLIIKKNIEIDGNGHNLNANKFGTIFYIYDGNVTLKNINFNAGKYSYGGAINIVKGNIKIIDCHFTGNYAEKKGCHIYSEQPNSLYIKGSTFIGPDDVTDENGLLYLKGNNICIDNCIFKNGGTSTYYTSTCAIINGKNVTVKNCNFNRSGFVNVLSIGGKNASIISCNFIRNDQCIYTFSDFTIIKNCYFNKNKYTLIDSESYKLILSNCTFNNNFNHTIVDWKGSSGEIIGCTFLENSNFDNFKFYKNFIPILINNTGIGVSTNIIIDKYDVYYNDPFVIYLKDITGKSLYSKQIIVDIGGYHYEMITKRGKYNVSPDGVVLLNISNIKKEGKYNANIYFIGDTDYDSSSLKVDIIINLKRNTKLQVNNITSYQPDIRLRGTLYGDNTIIDEKYETISYKTQIIYEKNISIYCNNETYNIYNNDGVSLKLNPGTYEIISYYEGDDIYASCIEKSIIKVLSSIILNDFKNEYENNINFNAKFLKKNGASLDYGTVLINVDGSDEFFKTNSEGFVNFNKIFTPGIHTLKIINLMTKEEIVKTITVKGSTPLSTPTKPVTKTTLTLKKVTVKRSAKKLTIQATLKVNGKAVKNKVIKFKFNKKTYNAKTNAKGVAKIKIPKKVLKKLKKGKKVTYTATFGKITKKVTVKVKK